MESDPDRRYETAEHPNRDIRWLSADEADVWLAVREFIWGYPSAIDRQLAQQSELSISEYSVMATITDSPEHRVRTGEVAEALGWERSRLSHLLKRMENRDLVERVPSRGKDRRAQDVILTPHGWDILQAAAPGHVTFVRETIFDPLTKEEQTQLSSMLTRIREAAQERRFWA